MTQISSFSDEDLISYLTLSSIEGVGPILAKNLMSYCGGVSSIFISSKNKLLSIPGVGAGLADKILGHNKKKWAENEFEFCKKNNIHILPFTSVTYPEYLKAIYNAPLLLFAKGQLDILNTQHCIAVVGTRKTTSYGRKQALALSIFLAENKITVVSGLALGIDTEAHKASLEHNGFTIAVLAHGLDKIYPNQNTSLSKQIQEKGLLITEYASNTPPNKYNFPNRNRIISGMCRAIVVVESPLRGGSLITAQVAFDQNREVYAVPGNLDQPQSEGCNALIRDNIAKLLVKYEEILIDLGIDSKNIEKIEAHNSLAMPLIIHECSENERLILNCLANGIMEVDKLISDTNLLPQDVTITLIGMEFKGWVEQLPGKRFKRLA